MSEFLKWLSEPYGYENGRVLFGLGCFFLAGVFLGTKLPFSRRRP